MSITDKRAHFRVNILEKLSGTAKILSISQRGVPEAVKKPILFDIQDLSAGGMRIGMSIDLPIEKRIILNVLFRLEDYSYSVDVQIVAKSKGKNGFEYGTKFLNLSKSDEQRLVAYLNKYKIQQVKEKKSQLELRKQKYVGSWVKMIEVIPYPTYLVNNRRIVVAANAAAKKFGVTLGERCYITVCKNHNTCAFCMLEESLLSDEDLSREVLIENKAYTAHWLNLEDGYVMHYFIP